MDGTARPPMIPSTPNAASIESAFRPAFEEIARRSTAASDLSKDDGVTHFERSTDATRLPFDLPDQDFVLVSVGTAVLAPRPVDSSRPALRVYGAFACKEHAVEHADIIREMDPECSLLVLKRNEWFLFPQTERIRDDPALAQERLTAKLAAHRDRQNEEDAAFERTRRERLAAPPPPADAGRPPPEEEEETADAEALVYKPPRRLRAGGDVRGQGVVAMCVIRDELGECLVKILGCFESTQDSDNWIRNVASRRITDDDVSVAPTCEWIYPNGVAATSSAPHYRVDELQRIMDAADRNPEAVRSYKEWKREQEERSRQVDRELLEEQAAQGVDQVVEQRVEQVVDQVDEQRVEQVVDEVVDQVDEQRVEQVVEQVVDQVVEQVVDQVVEQVVDQVVEQGASESDL